MGGIIQKKVLEDIRFKNDIADVVGAYIPLHRSGSALRALCPFHKEKTPSFYVNQNKQIYHCFGCGAGGDVFRFVMQHEGVDFASAARILAAKAGVRLEFEKGGSDDETDRSSLYELLGRLSDFYQRVLQSDAGKAGREYLAKRDIPAETVKEFGIGFAPDLWDSCIKWAAKHKHGLSDLEAAGMLVKSEKARDGSGYYDRFRNRLMFPIHDAQSRVIGFSGRMITAEEGTAKYVNSPETAVFRKSHILYALHKARHEIVTRHEAIICEGQIDVIRCHIAGFKNAVAAQGTAFTEDHARIIKRCADSVLLVFDSDTAGQDASVKASRVFMRSGLAVRVASLPEDEDPDSFIRKNGPEAFGRLLDGAVSAIRFQAGLLQSRGDVAGEVGAMRAAKSVLETIADSPNAVQRARLIQEAASLLNLPPSALESELGPALKAAARAADRPAPGGGEEKPAEIPSPQEERQLAEHIVAEPELGRLVEQYLPDAMFADKSLAAIIHAAVAAHAGGVPLVSRLAEHDDPDGRIARTAAALQMAPSRAGGKSEFSREQAVKDLILCVRRRDLRAKRASMEKLIQAGQADNSIRSECEALTRELQWLKNWDSALTILDAHF